MRKGVPPHNRLVLWQLPSPFQTPSPICHPDARGGTCSSVHQQPIPAGKPPSYIVILRACDFFDFSVFHTPSRCFQPLHNSVILPAPASRGSGAPHRCIARHSAWFARSRRTSAMTYSQMLSGAFRPAKIKSHKLRAKRKTENPLGSAATPQWEPFPLPFNLDATTQCGYSIDACYQKGRSRKPRLQNMASIRLNPPGRNRFK